MTNSQKVAVYWDFANCPIPTQPDSLLRCYEIVKRIRTIAGRDGIIQEFRAYLDGSSVTTQGYPRTVYSALSSVGVELLDCPHTGSKEVVDKRITVDMLLFAMDSASPVTIVLVAGDNDYMYAVAKLTHRKHKVVVISPEATSTSLKTIASGFHDWHTGIVGYQSTWLPHKAYSGDEGTCEIRESRNSRPAYIQCLPLVNSAALSAPTSCEAGSFESTKVFHNDSVDTIADDDDLNETKRVFVHPTELRVQSSVTGTLRSSGGDTEYLPTALSPSSLAAGRDLSAIFADESSTSGVLSRGTEESRGTRSLEAVTVPMPGSTANARTNPTETMHCSPRSDSSGLTPAPDPEAAKRFEPLINVITSRLQENNHDLRIQRTIIGEDLIKKYPRVYKDLNIGSFKQYSQQAAKVGIVELGGVPPKLWIQLKSRQ